MSHAPYVRKLPKLWWLGQRRYTLYMIRELTCVFIGAYSILLVVGLLRLSQGQVAYEAFLAALQGPFWIVFHVLAITFALFHTVTWFGVAPKAMPLRLGEKEVPDKVIIAAHYVGWFVVSQAVLFLARVS
jgi:fumarate reductase subunit C